MWGLLNILLQREWLLIVPAVVFSMLVRCACVGEHGIHARLWRALLKPTVGECGAYEI